MARLFVLSVEDYQGVGEHALVSFIAQDLSSQGSVATIRRASAADVETLPRLGGVAGAVHPVRPCNKCGYPVPWDGRPVYASAYYDCPRCWPGAVVGSEPEEGKDYWLAVEDAHR